MVKKCKVTINNEYVTVIKFGEIEVQLPAIHRKAAYLNIEYKNGIYKALPDDYIEPKNEEIKEKKVEQPKPKRKKTKKTTNETQE